MTDPITSTTSAIANIEQAALNAFQKVTTPSSKSKDQGKANQQPFYTHLFQIAISGKVYSSGNGEIIGDPFIQSEESRHKEMVVMLSDPDQNIFKSIVGPVEIQAEIKFINGPSHNVFKGKVWEISRVGIQATKIVAVDNLKTQASTQSAVIPTSPQQTTQPPVINPEDISGTEKVTFTKLPDLEAASKATSTSTTTNTSALPTPTGTVDNTGSLGQQLLRGSQLSFEKTSNTKITPSGSVLIQQNKVSAIAQDAQNQGDVIVTNGNQVSQIAPGQGPLTNVVLDYGANPGAFKDRPTASRKTGLQLQGYGAVTVVGWNTTQKEFVSGTAVTPGPIGAHPTGNIVVPQWGQVKLSDPIFPGCSYTWGDATKEGTRIPENQEIMNRIVAIAQVIQDIQKQYNNNAKLTITSWYRDPASNTRVGGATNSEHLRGHAVDWYIPSYIEVYNKLNGSWNGGLAYSNGPSGQFVHIDLGERARWRYS